jgi:hypothetical protein
VIEKHFFAVYAHAGCTAPESPDAFSFKKEIDAKNFVAFDN